MKLIKMRSRTGIDMSFTAEAVIQAYQELMSDSQWVTENSLATEGGGSLAANGEAAGLSRYLLFVTRTPADEYREVIITTIHDYISQEELRLVKAEVYPEKPGSVQIINMIDLGWMRDGQF